MINSQSKVIYFIRHARSVYNEAEHQVQEKYKQSMKDDESFKIEATPEYLNMKFQAEHWDCDIISPEGQKQCQQCRGKMKDISVDLVIVSPLRRALTTCELVFKNHKSRAPIIVDPMFREIFESICDIGSRLRESMRDYPQFDYSLIDNVDYWYLEGLNNEQAKKKLINEVKDLPQKQQHEMSRKLMLEYLKQLWEKRQKDPVNKLQALSPVSLQKSKLKLLLQKYDSIAIVTHSQNIKSYTGVKPPNCSIMKYKPEYFQLQVDQVPHQYV